MSLDRDKGFKLVWKVENKLRIASYRQNEDEDDSFIAEAKCPLHKSVHKAYMPSPVRDTAMKSSKATEKRDTNLWGEMNMIWASEVGKPKEQSAPITLYECHKCLNLNGKGYLTLDPTQAIVHIAEKGHSLRLIPQSEPIPYHLRGTGD